MTQKASFLKLRINIFKFNEIKSISAILILTCQGDFVSTKWSYFSRNIENDGVSAALTLLGTLEMVAVVEIPEILRALSNKTQGTVRESTTALRNGQQTEN